MRAPGEAPGMMALEIAMDEMAEKLGLDPVEFRILNDTQVDPEKPERPFSQRQLVECLRIGAERFGWSKRNAAARQGARRALAGRHGRGRRLPQQPGDEVGGARAPRRPRHRHGRDRHDRHRHRQLHDHRPDRGRDDGRAARQGRGAPGRFGLPGVGRLGRAMGRQQLDRRRLCRLHEAARGGARRSSASTPPTRCSPTAQVALGQPQRAAGRGGGRERPRRRGRHRVRRPRQEVPAVDLRRAFRRGRRRCRDRRDPRAPHARGLRRRPHPQPEDGAQPGDRRDDHGRRARR